MDSGSSGSIQTSSGGDEDYDSRAEGISGFLNNNPPGPAHVGPIANPPPVPVQPPAHHHPHSSSSMFDPFSNFFDPLPTRSHQNSLLNLDTAWPRNPRSDHNPLQVTGFIPPSSSSQTQSQSQSQSIFVTSQLQVPNQSNAPRGLTLAADPTEVVNNSANTAVRNPRKRTRASRRAPTTVLTTDTSNFRAMVQEFTGIPAPPFTPASSFPRARLDLFGGTSTSSPPYLLRPFPQKLSSPFASPTTTSLLSSSSDFLLPKQNHPTMNSIFNLQPTSPLQQPTHNSNINLLGSDLQVSVENAQTDHNRGQHLQTGLTEDFSLRDNGGGNILPTSWSSGGGAASDQALFRSINGKYCTSTKLNNYPASSSGFHGDKGSENVTTRSEGMIESWICSSD